ncbi:DUF6348 family protein [Aureivirga marina]|uniref:DUF6348 family protein n=1 Tax=Aureivirga marina TaxID=1182451 RepID=UPI0018C8FE1A|nr:DUF6348 family protein [Aureivirga marina]
MKLFNIFKSKKKEEKIDANLLVLQKLKEKIEEKGIAVEFSTKYAALIVASKIEIATAIMPGEHHQAMLPVIFFTINEKYFPKGIEASLVGLGNSIEEKVNSVIENYIEFIFETIYRSFSENHNEGLDFKTTKEREILWHVNSSDLILQGKWNNSNIEEGLFSKVEAKLKENLVDKKLNWLKIYVARQADGEITSECLLNNEIWEEGQEIIKEYAKTWDDESIFLSQKQFIVLRRCDAFDIEDENKTKVTQKSPTEYFHKLIEEPTKENYIKIRDVIFENPSFNPYSEDLNEIESLFEEEKYEEVSNYLNLDILLSPRAHFYMAFAFKKLKNEMGEKSEIYIYQSILQAISSTGDGTKKNPFLIVRISDERDLIQYLGEEFSSQQLVSEDGKFYDVISCVSGKKFYFDITKTYQRLKETMNS